MYKVALTNLPAVLRGLRGMENFDGAVLTMPHKTSAVALIDELTSSARLVGAVNVIRREPSGRLVGTLLDGEGFVTAIKHAGYSVGGKRCLVVGAGGVASAIAFALAKHRAASLCILNRTPTKAASLALRLRHAHPEIEVLTVLHPTAEVDIAVNCTSLGMQAGDDLPMDVSVIARSVLVAECVVAPESTELLMLAEKKGRDVLPGIAMLVAQIDAMLAFMCARAS